MKTRRRLGQAAGIAACLTVGLTLLGCTGSSSTPRVVDGDCELRLHSSGEVVRFSSLRGKTLFFHVWATWCGPCVMELPSVVRLADQLKDDPNIRFVLVSIDEKLSDVDAFLAEKGLTLPVYTLQSPLPGELQTEGIPATFFIDPQGKIRRQQVGAFEWDRKSVVDELTRLGQESSAGQKAQTSLARE
jgi:thiol-disulfide isomerase/thioredoxin